MAYNAQVLASEWATMPCQVSGPVPARQGAAGGLALRRQQRSARRHGTQFAKAHRLEVTSIAAQHVMSWAHSGEDLNDE